ncbi:GGDEF domain-containing protein (plasmid) [Ensifer sp. D2-11]
MYKILISCFHNSILRAAKLYPESTDHAGQVALASHQSFDRKISIRIILALLCTAILALSIVVPAYRDFTLSRQNLQDVQQYRLILDTANYLAAERGPANAVMSEEPSPDSASMLRLAKFRVRSDRALAQLEAAPVARFGLHVHPVPADLLQDVRRQLFVARAKVDHVAAVSRASLKLDEVQNAIESMFEVSDKFRALIAWNASELVHHSTGLEAPVLIGQMLSDLRDHSGRVGSEIIAPLATNQKIPLQNLIDGRVARGRLMELWQLVSRHAPVYSAPALLTSRKEIEQKFFRDGLGLVDEVISEGRSAPAYTLTATEFTNSYVPAMSPIETYLSAFLDTVEKRFTAAQVGALTTLAITLLATTAVLAFLVRIMLSMRDEVFRPLLQAHANILHLAADRQVPLPADAARAGEMRSLFEAIEELRGKLQERTMLMSELKSQAETDGLTALLNRRMLDRFARSSSTQSPADEYLCLILIDIDHFKQVNDTVGHLFGDRVLVQTAELLRAHLRASDLVARFGGEEFAILVPGNDLLGAIQIARKIRFAIQNSTFTTPDDAPFRVTASFGVACGRRGEDGWPELIANADAALYRAKSEGRNRVRFTRNTLPPSLVAQLHPHTFVATVDHKAASCS